MSNISVNERELNMGKKISGFTLAEALITLAVIGIVAVLTIPSLVKEYEDKQYNASRLKAFKIFGDAGKLASINGEIKSQDNAKNFANNVLSKYLKISKVCDTAEECNFPTLIQPSNPASDKLESDSLTSWSTLGGKNGTAIGTEINNELLSTYINTNNGFCAKLFYNPKCGRTLDEVYTRGSGGVRYYMNVDAACMNVIYDMNCKKDPNHVGEDIGIVTVFWSGLNSTSTAPGIAPHSTNATLFSQSLSQATTYCANKGTRQKSYSIPDIDEISSLYMNKNLTSLPENIFYSGTSAKNNPGYCWTVGSNGSRSDNLSSLGYGPMTWCVRR